MLLPRTVERRVAELARFPGVGRRSAERMAFDLVSDRGARIDPLVQALQHVSAEISECPECGCLAEAGRCLACSSARDRSVILVVEHVQEVLAFEKSGGVPWSFHVLGGHLSPLKGITPEKLKLAGLFSRCAQEAVRELIIATSPSVEGDATALYIQRNAERDGLRITRLGRGVPMGGSLEATDSGTLRLALESRQSMAGH